MTKKENKKLLEFIILKSKLEDYNKFNNYAIIYKQSIIIDSEDYPFPFNIYLLKIDDSFFYFHKTFSKVGRKLRNIENILYVNNKQKEINDKLVNLIDKPTYRELKLKRILKLL